MLTDPRIPIVAIVGRPNVGKSTLFNRLVGERDAIVFDTPGVTRDRKYGTVEWAGRTFTVIDTGGYVPRSDDVFEEAIREQAHLAIEEADAVVFVVDAITGLTPLDKELSDILRTSEKPIHLAVNKVDSEYRQQGQPEFYRLGLGEPHSIAALGGRAIGDFLDVITDGFAKKARIPRDKRLKLAVVGKPNVGKSSLVNALLGKRRQVVTDVPGTTRDPIDAILNFQGEEVVLVDTAGLRKRSKIEESIEFYSALRTLKALDRCDVAIIILDGSQGVDKQDVHIVDEVVERHRSAVIAVNKWDLVEKETNTALQYERAIRSRLGLHEHFPMVFVSALTRQRVTNVIEQARIVDAEQRRKITTSKLNKLLMADIEATPPSAKGPKEIRIKYITQVKTAPPLFAFFCNEPKLVPENYRRFLENRLRHHFGFAGVPIGLTFRPK
ncbi:MAG: ribosome biogenesis GTPase Der [Bacteroidetes bacterium]|jgi:GTP-binding protein|nr:ribosome biogenesis GTPase Der [Bacteroidota bacterium]